MSSFLVIFFLIIIIITSVITSLIYFLGSVFREQFNVIYFEDGILRIYNKKQGIYEIHSDDLKLDKDSEYLKFFEVGNKIFIYGEERYFEFFKIHSIHFNSLSLEFNKNELYKVIKSV